METAEGKEKITKKFFKDASPKKVILGVLILSLVLGVLTGYIIANKNLGVNALTGSPKTAQQDNRTFKDFAEGVIKARPAPVYPSEYVEGTHLLQRDGQPPVALTSSVVDLSLYEGKKVRVFGETQKALEAGWLMDVGKVEEIK
ncbi:hypothetical protein A3B42_01470 [Candidatus Daviesbacteria bacterium RIFCSPLOWO2_01_FULL_38_10]|uniref:Uncharacterized protein n=1 Tax=Candidatus Daviesbacteria bacterium GW2011_GWF2_38_6 TaxID=1618432 RepID=A0A0G0KNU7_9BACT|nr:MAG: hypothetical protein US80_C0001G0047 [Candidatus Daviesbacteria bacterium GW2011_GWA2_38_17]KKQ77125.1 MAG: hypothetical protein US99_C0048G0011 [Candidatus Daviesbacteria bacterium GW2011_GWF2_38_6]OGE27271.1 MAG: hypothetical protein A3D02_03135 [Candidatus Daviesbacteria bacterium RIFCSPHIGHO2_02_FULL_39_41]OGE27652.1 MAG: hypothetical protein A2772_02885 [Candidatus Daviesbacteria bacterium RIFCSPHIGHO2_01_FULL_38_8b]OGE37194.1 MAG: hypothetical protein A3B42_01470 [Candidatus Davie